jgi:amidase
MGPSTNNGIVGIKPTLGLVGRSGIIPISSTLDTAGPMARTVRDAAALLSVIARPDPDDAACRQITASNKFPVDYTKYLDSDGLKGIRIGINRLKRPEDINNPREEENMAFNNLCKVIANAGAILVDNINIESSTFTDSLTIMRFEFKTCMNYYLSTLKGSSSIKNIKDIITYNQANAATALKYGQSRLIDAENNTGSLTESAYFEVLNKREKTVQKLNRLFDENHLNILLCEHPTLIAPFTGFPSMTIPLGQRKDKLPIGSYWIARRFDEAQLITAAYAAEQILNLKLRPDFIEKI